MTLCCTISRLLIWPRRCGPSALDHPFHITICKDSLKAALIFILCYGLGLGIFLSNDRNYRRREEHGSAKWGSAGIEKETGL